MSEVKTYTIGGKTYLQRPLVLAEFGQLVGVLRSVPLPQQAEAGSVLLALGDHVVAALAVVLTPQRRWPLSLMPKSLPRVARHLARYLTAEQAMEVVRDFFVCNPIASICAEWRQAIGESVATTGPSESSAPSPAATPAAAAVSCDPSKSGTSICGSSTASAS